jgi:signal transduction histidine kinase
LRFRLAVWNAIVVLLTAVATLVGVREGVRAAILYEMDQILIEDIEEVSLALQELPANEFDVLTDELARKALGHRQHGWFVQLCATGNQVVWSSREDAGGPLQFSTTHTPRPVTVDDVRIVERHVPGNVSGITTVRVGSELEFLRADMGRIDRLVMMAAGIVLVTAPLVGYWLAGRATRHLGAITRTAQRMRPDHLEERLTIQGTGDELDQLAETINRLLDQIGEYLQQKRDFLANSAHELRTPLAAIRSSIEVALVGDRNIEEYQELLIDIIDRGTMLETLVNQLLLISESEGERLRMDLIPVAFDEIVRQSADMFEGVAESRNITFDVRADEHVVVSGKPHLLLQLMNNLIDNALKYTPSGGHVQVSLSIEPKSATALLRVKDTGIGIAPEDHAHIFDRFFRADKSRTRLVEATGTGLGLSICQAVTLAHGGTIRCESKLHAGTEFIVELPICKSPLGLQAHTIGSRI